VVDDERFDGQKLDAERPVTFDGFPDFHQCFVR
jgi:hypothetical protein